MNSDINTSTNNHNNLERSKEAKTNRKRVNGSSFMSQDKIRNAKNVQSPPETNRLAYSLINQNNVDQLQQNVDLEDSAVQGAIMEQNPQN
jgi:hypothetical protein